MNLLVVSDPADAGFHDDFVKHAVLLQRSGIQTWSTDAVQPGLDRRTEIVEHLDTADVVVLLLSADFLASELFDGAWFWILLRARLDAGARLLPVLVRPCDWKQSPLGHLRALPRNEVPVTEWQSPDTAWLEVVREIRGTFDRSSGKDPSERPQSNAPPRHASDSLRSTGESRICTVMFVDFSDFALNVDAGHEDLIDVLRGAQDIVTAHIERAGGLIDPVIGARAVAVFGVPHTGDNDAECALLAACSMTSAMERRRRPRRTRPPMVRIGVATESVFVRLGADRLTVLGKAVTIAAKLAETARGGDIIVDWSTYRLVAGRFNVEPLTKGIAKSGERASTYRVHGTIAHRQVFLSDDFYGIKTTFVGRAAERQYFDEALETAIAERRTVLMTVSGEAGCGKTRLLAELLSSVAERKDWFILALGQGSQWTHRTSYGLLMDIVRRRFGADGISTTPDVLSALRRGARWLRIRAALSDRARREQSSVQSQPFAVLEEGLEDPPPADLEDALRTLSEILATPRSGTDPIGDMDADRSGAIDRKRVAISIDRLVTFATRRAPLIIVCDDMQWADDASIDLLEDILTRVDSHPVLIVAAYRPAFQERRPTWGSAARLHTRLQLGPLRQRHLEEMVRDRLQRIGCLPDDILQELVDRAEGSPFALVETLHLLVDAGVIEPSAHGSWKFHAGRLGEVALPLTVQGLVQARIDQLDPESRDVLAHAAIVGRTFWDGAVSSLCDDVAAHLRPAAVPPALRQLCQRQFLRRREPARFQGQAEYFFIDTSAFEVAQAMLGSGLRRTLHLSAAAWLERQGAAADSYSSLAYHYDQGGDVRRAVREYLRAAKRNMGLGENAEALQQLERACDLIHEGSEGSMETRDWSAEGDMRVADWRDRVQVKLDLGDVLRRTSRIEEARTAYEAARRQIISRERRRHGEQIDPHEPILWDARIDFRLALTARVQNDIAGARFAAERAFRGAVSAQAFAEAATVGVVIAWAHRREGRLDLCESTARESLRLCRRLGPLGPAVRPVVAELLVALGAVHYSRGLLVRAERSYRQAVRLLDDARHPLEASTALNDLGAVLYAKSRLPEAHEMFLRSLVLKKRIGDHYYLAIGHNNVAEVELKLGHPAKALEHARKAVEAGERCGARGDLADFQRNLAEAALLMAQLPSALEAATSAGRLAVEQSGLEYSRACRETLRRVLERAIENGDAATQRGVRDAAEVLSRLQSYE